MKLVHKIFLFQIVIAFFIFFLGGSLFYHSFRKEIYEELDEHLRDEKRNIERLINEKEQVPSFNSAINSQFQINEVPLNYIVNLQRKDTVINHPAEGEIPFRQWSYTYKRNGKNYLIVIRKSLIDLYDLSAHINRSLSIGLGLMLILMLIVNTIVLEKIFEPFYKTLQIIRQFSLKQKFVPELPKTSTNEFKDLNKNIKPFLEKIMVDYQNVKEFTENTSHEIQTLLAIIKNKLELLAQSEHLINKDSSLLGSAIEAAERLSRLNQSLILLTRIENLEFTPGNEVNLTRIVEKVLLQMQEMIQLKNIEVNFIQKGQFYAPLNLSLAEVLVSNLIVNAVNHYSGSGPIKVISEPLQFSIANPGKPLTIPVEKLFYRFVKGSGKSTSMGIGLALVKKIAEVNNLKVGYEIKEGYHTVVLIK